MHAYRLDTIMQPSAYWHAIPSERCITCCTIPFTTVITRRVHKVVKSTYLLHHVCPSDQNWVSKAGVLWNFMFENFLTVIQGNWSSVKIRLKYQVLYMMTLACFTVVAETQIAKQETRETVAYSFFSVEKLFKQNGLSDPKLPRHTICTYTTLYFINNQIST